MRECYFCEKKVVSGGHITHRGIPKKKGGIGLQLVKNTKRKFKPNLQKIHFKVDAKPLYKLVCTACIRSGKAIK